MPGYAAATCWHEAAHAVTARALGLEVVEARVDSPDDVAGRVRWRPDPARVVEEVATWLAPSVFARMTGGELGCHGTDDDQRAVTRLLVPVTETAVESLAVRHAAERMAEDVLKRRRDDVQGLARRLQQHGSWSAERGWRRGPSLDEQRRQFEAQSQPGPVRQELVRAGTRAAQRPDDVELRRQLARAVSARLMSPVDADKALLRAGVIIHERKAA